MAEIAIFEHFKPKLEVFRPKMDPIQVFCAEKAFPHGFRTVIARLGCLLAIFIILIGIDDRKKKCIDRDLNPGPSRGKRERYLFAIGTMENTWCFLTYKYKI